MKITGTDVVCTECNNQLVCKFTNIGGLIGGLIVGAVVPCRHCTETKLHAANNPALGPLTDEVWSKPSGDGFAKISIGRLGPLGRSLEETAALAAELIGWRRQLEVPAPADVLVEYRSHQADGILAYGHCKGSSLAIDVEWDHSLEWRSVQ
jgi:hypothetical protein